MSLLYKFHLDFPPSLLLDKSPGPFSSSSAAIMARMPPRRKVVGSASVESTGTMSRKQ